MNAIDLRTKRREDDAHDSDAVWTPHPGLAVRIVGAGAYVAPHVVTADDIASAIPGWAADKIVEKTGVVERRYLWPLDAGQGRAICLREEAGADRPAVATATDMAEVALKSAVRMSDVAPRDIDLLIVVTCTPDRPRFSHDAMALRRRLGMRTSAHCFVVDSGCGGSLYMLDMVARMLEAGSARTAAIVGTHFTSPMIDRGVYAQEGPVGEDGKTISPYLSAYVFGDGAGAIVLRRDRDDSLGIRASIAGNDCQDLVRSPGGGALSPAYGDRYRAIDHAFIVNGRLVAATYLQTMARCMTTVTGAVGTSLDRVERFYLHQANERMLRALADRTGLRAEQVASNVAWVGNTSSAGMFMLLAEDLERGRVAMGIYLLAGDYEAAIAHLRAAAGSCSTLDNWFSWILAHEELGEALAAGGDTRSACDEFRVVLAKWGSAKPRSVTADKARAQMQRLRCPK